MSRRFFNRNIIPLAVLAGVSASVLLLQDRYGDYAAFSMIFACYMALSFMERRKRLRKEHAKPSKNTSGTAR